MTTKTRKNVVGQEKVDTRLAKALSNPLRHRVLSRLNEGVASPKELSEEFGQPLARVSYHVGILRELGLIELVRTEPRRGATEHYYRALSRPFFSDSDWATLPQSAQRSIIDQHLRRIFDDVAAAVEAGGFGFDEMHVSWTPLDLDAEGLADVSAVLGEALDRVLEIHAESAGRQIEGGRAAAPPIRTEVALLHFERPPTGDRAQARKPRKDKKRKKKQKRQKG